MATPGLEYTVCLKTDMHVLVRGDLNFKPNLTSRYLGSGLENIQNASGGKTFTCKNIAGTSHYYRVDTTFCYEAGPGV